MRVSKFALTLFLLLTIAGCAVDRGKIYVKDGKQYGVTSSEIWHGRWWNYYERGTSYANGEFWTDAIADLQEAIQQRDSDQRRARTYGLHFLDEYFPHRELGVIYYRLGRYPEAISELQISLRQADSAKAKFYLNKARRGQLGQTKVDTAPPRIVLDSPQNGLLTRHFIVPVRGYVEDDTYVSSITINGRAEFIELAEPRRSFTRELKLRDGVNTIDVVAVDLVGKPTRQQFTVTLDRQGPLVSVGLVQRLGPISSHRVRLEGTLTDSNGVVRFVLAGQEIQPQAGQGWDFLTEVLLLPGLAAIPFEAEDAAGNITRGDIPLTATEGEAPGMQKGVLPLLPRWASLALGPVLSDLNNFGVVPWYLAQSAGKQPKPPVIKFRDPNRGIYAAAVPMRTTYYDTVYVEGQVISSSPITHLTINEESLWRVEKTIIFFGYNALLEEEKEQEHRFVVATKDKAGNQDQRELVVTHKIPKVKQSSARLSVALSPMAQQGEVVTSLSKMTDDALQQALFNQKRFRLMERSKLDLILREHKLAPVVDKETAVKIGKLLQVEGIVVGSVYETSDTYKVYVRFVDVETSEQIVDTDVYGEALKPADVDELMTGLASKVRESLPLVQGSVLKAEGKKILVNLGSKEIKRSMRLLIFRCEGNGIVQNASPAADCDADTEVLDEASVEEVSMDRSRGILRQGKTSVKETDKVITR